MRIATIVLPIAMVVGLLIPTGVLALVQYFLSRLESPWPGRVLPILSAFCSVCFSGLLLFNIAADSPSPVFLVPLAALILLNIPTAVYLIVYRVTRRSYVEKRNMERRDIEDL